MNARRSEFSCLLPVQDYGIAALQSAQVGYSTYVEWYLASFQPLARALPTLTNPQGPQRQPHKLAKLLGCLRQAGRQLGHRREKLNHQVEAPLG